MSEQSKIQWTDSTANFWEGCTKVSAGCANCYAEARDKRFTGGKHWGKGAPRRKSQSAVKDCLKWNKKPWVCENGHANEGTTFCYAAGCESQNFHRRRVFSLSLGDWLDPEVPVEWLAEMLDTIRCCDQLTFILCTKRPDLWKSRMVECVEKVPDAFIAKWVGGDAPQNIWLLTSVENQQAAEERIPKLLEIPAVLHGLSCEPLLGPLAIGQWLVSDYDKAAVQHQFIEPVKGFNYREIKWVILGGESGANARPCNVQWIRDVLWNQSLCAMFVKQLGAKPRYTVTPYRPEDLNISHEFVVRDPKGGDLAEWPADLRVQEWPTL